MGQKVHPTGIRLGVGKDHNSVWYADSKTYAKNLINDLEVREYILKKLDAASVSRVKIERPAQTARITIFTARPGIVIGKKGEEVDGLRKDLSAKMGVPVHINIEEIRKPDVDARLVADQVRGKPVEEALSVLEFSNKKAATIVRKVLNSAIANAENNEGADVDELRVSTIYVDEGSTMKRLRARAKGRGDRIFKRTCHITVKVADNES